MKLPAFTFIHGPAVLSTEVANLITDSLVDVQGHSFQGPLRDAVLGLFFGGDPSIDIGARLDLPTPCAPIPEITFKRLLDQLHRDLRTIYGTDILGQLAVTKVQENAEFFSRFVFDDLNFELLTDARRVIKAFDAENCLIINLVADSETLPLKSQNVRTIDIVGGTPTEILQAITNELERPTANPETPQTP